MRRKGGLKLLNKLKIRFFLQVIFSLIIVFIEIWDENPPEFLLSDLLPYSHCSCRSSNDFVIYYFSPSRHQSLSLSFYLTTKYHLLSLRSLSRLFSFPLLILSLPFSTGHLSISLEAHNNKLVTLGGCHGCWLMVTDEDSAERAANKWQRDAVTKEEWLRWQEKDRKMGKFKGWRQVRHKKLFLMEKRTKLVENIRT